MNALTVGCRKLSRLVLVGACLIAGSVFAQGTSVLQGSVTDTTTHQPIVDAVVTVVSPTLQGEQYGITDETGVYRIPNLPAGPYKLRVEKEAYKVYSREEITLRLDWTTRVNLELLPDTLKEVEEIVVVARSPTIDIGSSNIGLNIGASQLANLAIATPGAKGSASRSFEALAELAPGAFFDRYGVSLTGATSPENLFVIDGLSVTNPGSGLWVFLSQWSSSRNSMS